jgi:hypothetical protein
VWARARGPHRNAPRRADVARGAGRDGDYFDVDGLPVLLLEVEPLLPVALPEPMAPLFIPELPVPPVEPLAVDDDPLVSLDDPVVPVPDAPVVPLPVAAPLVDGDMVAESLEPLVPAPARPLDPAALSLRLHADTAQPNATAIMVTKSLFMLLSSRKHRRLC